MNFPATSATKTIQQKEIYRTISPRTTQLSTAKTVEPNLKGANRKSEDITEQFAKKRLR